MPKAVSFVLLLSWLAVAYGVRVFTSPKLNPSSFLPIGFDVKVNTELFCLPVKVNFIIECICYLFIISSWSNTNLNSANADRVLEHFASNFYLICVLVFIDLNDSELSLSDKKDYGNGGLISCQTDTDVGVIGVE